MEKFVIGGGKALSGKIKVSGAKNSALKLIAASILADSRIILRNVPAIEDVNIMLEMLKTLGAGVDVDREKKVIEINPESIESNEAPYDLVRKMRASILVAGPLLSKYGNVKVAIPGGCNIGSRHIDLHVKGFEKLGAVYSVEHGYVNCRTDSRSAGGRLSGAEINLEFPSRGATENIMMASALAEGQTVIRNAAREPEIIDLACYLNSMGAEIEGAGTGCVRINGVKSLKGTDYEVMPDSIEAGTFITAGALCGDGIEIENARLKNLKIFYDKLKAIGVNISAIDENNIKVEKPLDKYRPTNISTLPYPGFPTDLQPIITVLLSIVPGVSVLTENVFENRFMYVDELNRMGTNIKIDGHRALIKGVGKLSGAPVRSFDLRAGAAMVLAGLAAEGYTEVSDIYHIKRGYEDIEAKLRSVGADIRIEEQGGEKN
ncbi:MAG: UDP-N-acetylglucosamine 1-carboxyvinyltransferase [Actinomycetota bacterium]|nr:UDP-N-acetylglucosamine 1-carboxyvinyltransferase [Actinomycetota bacterium]